MQQLKSLCLVMMLVMMSVCVSSQSLTTSMICMTEKVCEDEQVCTASYDVFTYKNKSVENTTVLSCDVRRVCEDAVTCDKIKYKDTTIDYKLQDYNCLPVSDGIICDSCVDGNCDGLCSLNGGETCIKLSGSGIIQKNNAVDWSDTGSFLPSLEVKG